MNTGTAKDAPAPTGERADLLESIRRHRYFLRYTVRDLTDEQAGLRPTPSTICLGSLVKHVTFVQRGWLEQALHAPAPVPPTGEDRNASWQEADRVGLDVSDPQLIEMIQNISAFQEDGKFSKKRYEELLRGQGMTPKAF